jgi:hypothetical protein
MKRSELKSIIKEEVNRAVLIEGIIDKLLMLFIGPKLQRDINTLKTSTEWKELMQKVKVTADEIETIQNRLKSEVERCKKLNAQAKRLGLKQFPCGGAIRHD